MPTPATSALVSPATRTTAPLERGTDQEGSTSEPVN